LGQTCCMPSPDVTPPSVGRRRKRPVEPLEDVLYSRGLAGEAQHKLFNGVQTLDGTGRRCFVFEEI
ncbi:hypothetical protein GOODEAATRI_033585, partial [Goodea atripinnis]